MCTSCLYVLLCQGFPNAHLPDESSELALPNVVIIVLHQRLIAPAESQEAWAENAIIFCKCRHRVSPALPTSAVSDSRRFNAPALAFCMCAKCKLVCRQNAHTLQACVPLRNLAKQKQTRVAFCEALTTFYPTFKMAAVTDKARKQLL